MFVLFEESGSFKAGAVLAESDASLQVQTSTGKRIKLKRASVLLTFDRPEPEALLAEATEASEALDVAFLYEVCSDEEFGFAELAEEYHGHPPSAVEQTALLMRLHAHPVWFHRKNKGRFRKAPADILQAALAGLERKRQQAEQVESMRAQLVAGELPASMRDMVAQLLYRPDRNRLETKAFEAACVDTGLSAPSLMVRCGALASSHDFHFNRFLFDQFPEGVAFPDLPAPEPADELPIADVAAFSLDDATTTEIDDAFSVVPHEGGGWQIGIHIAAPGLGCARGSAFDEVARARLSTVYMPGSKITMLPPALVDVFTLAAGTDRPALSLYLDVNADLSIAAQRSVIERVPVVANLRHHDIEPLFNEETLLAGGPEFALKRELTVLWDLATVLEAGRGKPSANLNQLDYVFSVDWARDTPAGKGHVSIGTRKRGSPMDKLVAEMMIHANATWGKLLDKAGVPGIYRVQSGGKVRMATACGPHEGLGVDGYAWSSSPLRRYVDLVNQWQLISVLRETEPPFPPRSPDLGAVVQEFDAAYATYAEFQRQMERYWCVRRIVQEGREHIEAIVLRDNVVREVDSPLVFKVPSMPLQLPGSRVRLKVKHCNLFDVEVATRFECVLAEPTDGATEEDPLFQG